MSTAQEPLYLPKYLQELELSQEDREFIISLPTEKGWVANYLHRYQGFWHTTRQLRGILAFQKHFQAQKTDIFLATTPKSGSTWLKAIIYALMYRAQFPDFEKHPLFTINPHALVPFIEYEYIEEPFPNLDNLKAPRFFATHLSFESLPKSVEESGCKIVYLCRNPKDTFVSFWHFTSKLRLKEKGENSLEETLDKFCRGVSLHGPFWDHVLSYWRKKQETPERVLFLKYEDVQRDPKAHLKRLSEFIGGPFTTEEESNRGVVDEILKLCSFDNLSNLEVNKIGKLPSGEAHQAFFRRGQVGDAINYLTAEMSERIDRITEQKLHGSGLNLNGC